MRRAALALLALLPVAALGTSVLDECRSIRLRDPDYADEEVHYDISSLTENRAPYEVDDRERTTEFDYVFDVCKPLTELPSQCAAGTPFDNKAAAYQVANLTTNECHLLGLADSSVDFAFVDPSDPGVGVEIKYSGGEPCGTVPRTFTVRVYCDQHHHASEVPRLETSVFEPDLCTYEVDLIHFSGCPQQCLAAGENGDDADVLCDGNGICSVDSDARAVRCFCYEGRGGSHCQKRDSNVNGISTTGTSATPALEAVVIVLMLVLLAVAALWYVRSRAPSSAGGGGGSYGQMGDNL